MDLSEMTTGLQAAQEEARQKLVKVGQEAMGGAFRELFAEWPDLTSIQWTQYTPHFNDGDACVFDVNEFLLATFDGQEVEDPGYKKSLPAALQQQLQMLNSAMREASPVLKEVFGDHAEVIATRDGFEVQEYEHD